ATGRFIISQRFERPVNMPNFNNEGFAMAPEAECVNHLKPAYWADDTEDNGHAIRRGTVPCVGVQAEAAPTPSGTQPEPPVTPVPTVSAASLTFAPRAIGSGGLAPVVGAIGPAQPAPRPAQAVATAQPAPAILPPNTGDGGLIRVTSDE